MVVMEVVLALVVESAGIISACNPDLEIDFHFGFG